MILNTESYKLLIVLNGTELALQIILDVFENKLGVVSESDEILHHKYGRPPPFNCKELYTGLVYLTGNHSAIFILRVMSYLFFMGFHTAAYSRVGALECSFNFPCLITLTVAADFQIWPPSLTENNNDSPFIDVFSAVSSIVS